MIEKRNRINIGSFDLIKGLAIIMFVLSHSFERYDLNQSVVLKTIPIILLLLGEGARTAFYIISGMPLKETTPSKMLKKTFHGLLVPYLWVMAAYLVLFPLVRYPFMPYWREVFTYALKYVAAFLLGNIEYGKIVFGFEIYWCTPMYFFLSMFIALNILNLILKCKKIYIQIFCVVFCVVVGNILLSQKIYWFCLPYGLPAVGFCYIGYILKNNNLFWKLQYNKWTYFVLVPIYLIGCGLGIIANIFAISGFVINIAIWITSIFSAVLLLYVFDFITSYEWKAFNWLKKVGVYSYWIICIHSFEAEAIPWFLFVERFPQNHLLVFVFELLIKAVIIIIGCVLLKQITKWRYKRRMIARGK